ncbi:FHA domain-containing protein [Agromyces aerolatus]|uniref:FHA domain-containing protein n=1 Tax=Agromyces sp. LY-1074 TaxID=3074080 RepID=UPI00285EBD24|nr:MULTISPECIES: FHA domain-containing protein [unclassified Agromyces]MDR5701303.1 FHA domain-containing protein [Agromyces sp. LY-1074]MDR5707561.1 FHA domain-containing protein [Agromyces sp. LY-1358]
MVPGEVRAVRDAGAPEWVVALAGRFLLALPSSADAEATVGAVTGWAASGEPDGELEQLIARIPLGEGGAAGFALVWWPPGAARLTAVVRGSGAVDLMTTDGPRRLEAGGIRPWHLAEFRDVLGVRIGPAIADGVAWADVSDWPGPAGHPGASPRVTSIEWRSTSAAPATEPIATQAAAGAPDGDDSGDAPEAGAASRAAWFRMPGGEARDVAGVVLIGRRPAPPRIANDPLELVRVDPSAVAVSATHLELRRAGARIVATDLHSTNGTIVRTPAGARRMRAGESIVVAAGAVLELGGDTIVEILPPPQDHAHPDRQVPE